MKTEHIFILIALLFLLWGCTEHRRVKEQAMMKRAIKKVNEDGWGEVQMENGLLIERVQE